MHNDQPRPTLRCTYPRCKALRNNSPKLNFHIQSTHRSPRTAFTCVGHHRTASKRDEVIILAHCGTVGTRPASIIIISGIRYFGIASGKKNKNTAPCRIAITNHQNTTPDKTLQRDEERRRLHSNGQIMQICLLSVNDSQQLLQKAWLC